MTRSKSPFRSFRFKKKSAPDTGSEHGLEDDDNMRAIGKIIGNLVMVTVMVMDIVPGIIYDIHTYDDIILILFFSNLIFVHTLSLHVLL